MSCRRWRELRSLGEIDPQLELPVARASDRCCAVAMRRER